MRYRVQLVADVVIEAENVMEAARLSRRLRIIGGTSSGLRKELHWRRSIRYSMSVTAVNVSRPAKEGT